MAGLTASGFIAKTQAEIEQSIADGIRSRLSGTMDLSARSPMGEIVGIFSSELAQSWEAAQDNYTAKDIDQATGDSLSAVVKRRGTKRNGAQPSTALMTITLAAGTYTAGTLVVSLVGDATARFSNDADITVASPTTLVDVPFTCEKTGAVRAIPGTLTVIANPVVGFSAPTNPAEAILGTDQEIDSALRLRSDAELARKGSATVDAIRADLLNVKNPFGGQLFSFVAVFENDGDSVDSAGRAPHAIEAVLLGGTDQQAADAVALAKTGGIKAYGLTVLPVVNSQGDTLSIGFTRPTTTPVYVKIVASVLASFAGAQVLLDAITDWADLNQSVGVDVLIARYVTIAMQVPGMVDISLEVGLSAMSTSASNLVIGPRAVASIDQGNIATTFNVVQAAP